MSGTSAGTGPNTVADDFSVGGAGWNVQTLSFFSYQSFAASAFTFTNATWSVIKGDVNTGTLVASGITAVTNGGLQGFRVTSTTLTNTDRAIFRVNVDVPDFNLAAGSYWLRWSLAGSTTLSGPWQPPTADGRVGNAQQAQGAAAFGAVVDAGDSLGMELPFVIGGTVNAVPEPATYALWAMGVVAMVGAARRRKG